MIICFFEPTGPIPAAGHRICVEIPVYVNPDWRIPQPDPPPWLILDDKPFEFAKDLRILATIAELSPKLSPEFGKALTGSIDFALSALNKKLPEGMEVGFRQGTHSAECAE